MAAASPRFLGRLAVVTGGGRGIGQAVCQHLANQGASIAVVDINRESVEETVKQLPIVSSNQHSSFVVDVSSRSGVNNMVKDIFKTYDRAPCILVNSAGIVADEFVLKMEEEKFDRVLNINLKGTFLMLQAVAKLMVDSKIKNGSIVNLASIVGKVGNIGQANYCASKAGVEGLTKTCAKELARYGIRCNAVLPGIINTPMIESIPEKVSKQLKNAIPLGRMGNPSDVAEVVSFLASSQSSYITGASIEVAGGLFM